MVKSNIENTSSILSDDRTILSFCHPQDDLMSTEVSEPLFNDMNRFRKYFDGNRKSLSELRYKFG
jgi:cellobiose-specific phosphotransferase system component IIA